MEVQQSAYLRLVIAHSRCEMRYFSRKIFDEYFDDMSLHLFLGDLMNENVMLVALGQPVLSQFTIRLDALGNVLTHQYNNTNPINFY